MKFLFVTGIQRSGTTALANLLNWHSEISVCIERYKNLMLGQNFKHFEPELFEKENLLDFSNDYTNCTPDHSERFASFYSDLERKYDGLKYIGDKIPNSYARTPAIYQRFPNMKFLFIVRNIEDTASSWQARAENVKDGWPASKTAEKAIERWNDCNRTIIDLHAKHPDDVYIVDYNEFFDGDPEDSESYDSLLEFLELGKETAADEAFKKARIFYRDRVKTKERVLSAETEKFITKNADIASYELILHLAHNRYPFLDQKAA